MGKIELKLSWALQRELDVRRSLGKSCPCAKGYRGARRAAELYAANRAARTRMPSWSTVPQDVLENVLQHVSLADLLNLRLAGFGGRDLARRERLRSLFCERRERLRDVMTISTTRVRSARLLGLARVYCPVQFSSLENLTLHLHGVAGEMPGVPEGIDEMHGLRLLTIVTGGPVFSLPDSIVRCKHLRSLCLSGLAFKALPRAILELAKLRELNLSGCSLLESLPEDMGERLKNLSKLDVRGCTNLHALPRSVLRRLERSKRRAPLLLDSSELLRS